MLQFCASRLDGGIQPLVAAKPIVTRRLHVRNALLLATALLVGIGALHGLHYFQVRRLAVRLLTKADDARAANNLSEAARRLNAYVKLRPEDDDARGLLGLVRAETARSEPQFLRALMDLERALVRVPQRSDFRRKAAELSLMFGRVTDAQRHVELLLNSKPDDPGLQLLLGRCLESGNHSSETALAFYRRLIETSPRFVPAYERLAGILERTSREPADGERLLEQMLSSNPDSAEALIVHARYAMRHGEFSRALTDTGRAFLLAPGNIDILCLLAELNWKRTEASDAISPPTLAKELRQAIERAIIGNPKESRLYLAHAEILLVVEDRTAARKTLQDGLAHCPQKRELELCLTDLLLTTDNLDEASRQIARFKATHVDPALTTFLEARLLMARKNWPQAVATLLALRGQALLPRDLNFQIELHLGRCCRKIRHPARQTTAMRRAVALAPESIEARLELAAALTQDGNLDEAAAGYRSLPREPGVVLKLAKLLLRRNLETTADERDWNELTSLIDDVAHNQPEAPDLVLLRAQVLAHQDRLDIAGRMLAAGCSQFPEEIGLRCAWADVMHRLGEYERARAIIKTAEEELGLSPEVILERFRLLRENSEATSSTRCRELVRDLRDSVNKASFEKHFDLIEACAIGAEQAGDLESAKQFWKEAAAIAPHDIAVVRRRLDLALRGSDDEKILARIGELRDLEGDTGLYWRLGTVARAMNRARRGEPVDLKQGRLLLHEVAGEFPEALAIPVAVAEIAELQNDANAAVQYYRDALDRGLRRTELLVRAARLLAQLERFPDFEQLLAQFAPGETCLQGELGRLAAEVALRIGNRDLAISRAKAVIHERTRDFHDFVWLSGILDSAGQPNEAEAALRTGCERSDGDPGSWLALVHWLVEKKRPSEAELTLNDAVRRFPEPIASLASAEGSALIGRMDLAEEKYHAAVALAPHNTTVVFSAADFFSRIGNLSDAEPLWRNLSEIRDKSFEHQLPAVRRGLAACLLARGSSRTLSEALGLLKQNVDQVGNTISDQRLKARVLAMHPGRLQRKESLSILTQLGENAALAPDDQMLMAQVHLRLGDWAAARAEFQDLIASGHRNTEHLAFAIGKMLEHEPESDTVIAWLDRLAELEPDSFRTRALKFRWLAAQNRGDEARRMLREAVELDSRKLQDAILPGVHDKTGDAAALLADEAARLEITENLEQAAAFWQAAEEIYGLHISRDPRGTPDIVLFLARRGRRADALKLAEQNSRKCRAAELASALVALLQIGEVAEEDFRRVRAIFAETFSESDTADAAVLMSMGNLAQIEARYDEAEKNYRRVLAKDEFAVLAANNLAYLLAMRGGDLKEALALINRALAHSCPTAALLDTRAVIYLGLGRSTEAMADIELALDSDSTPALQFHRCQTLLASGRWDAAQSAYRSIVAGGVKASQLPPLERETWQKLKQELKIP